MIQPSAGGLDVRHLEALRAVVEHGTFGRAAVALGYTQSAISQQIASLERSTGVELFDRRPGPRPPVLTEAGRRLDEHGSAVLDRLRLAAADLEEFRAGERGRVAVGTFQSISVSVLPILIARMHVDHPAVDVTLLESDEQPRLIADLLAGHLDVSFAVEPVLESGVETTLLFEDAWMVLTPVDDPPEVDSRGEVPLAWLRNRPLVGQTSSHCQLLVETNLRKAGVEAEVVFRTADNKAVANMVRTGMGAAVMPLLAVDDSDDVLATPLDRSISPRRIVLALASGRSATPAMERFVALAEEISATARAV